MLIAQLNMQNSRVVGEETREILQRKKVDVLMAQEPYSVGGKVRGFGLSSSFMIAGDSVEQIRPMAALVCRPDTEPMELLTHKTPHFSTAEFNMSMGKFYIISGYFQYRDEIEPCLGKLGEILTTLRGKEVLIGLDANAKSPLWHSNVLDERGEELEGLIARFGLVVVNEDDQPATYMTGSSIDVTLATPGLARRISGWTVHEAESSSDHRLITMKVNSRGPQPLYTGFARYNVRRLDVEDFNYALADKLNGLPEDGPSEVLARLYNDALSETLSEKCPKFHVFEKPVPWWNRDLTEKRKQLRVARRSFQRCGPGPLRDRLQREYQAKREVYFGAIRISKKTSWEAFVKTNSNENPYGFAYKLGASKLRLRTIMTNLRVGEQGYTATTEETMERLLEVLMPLEDPRGGEDLAERAPRLEMVVRDFELRELKDAIMKAKAKRAPGPDRIPIDVIKLLDERHQSVLLELLNRCWREGVFPEVWKRANITILRKAGDRDWALPESYRPISLLPVVGKTYERLVHSRLMTEVMENSLISNNQYGFMPGRGTTDALLKITSTIHDSQRKYAVGVFLDIQGAFNELSWGVILRSLRRMGVSEGVFNVISS